MASPARTLLLLFVALFVACADARTFDAQPASISSSLRAVKSHGALLSVSALLTKAAAEARGHVVEATQERSTAVSSPTVADLCGSFAGCMCIGLVSCA